MKIIQDTKTTFRVTGDRDLVYAVDLDANGKRGKCNCKHFQVRVQSAWNRGHPAEPCKHILFAWGYTIWNRMHK